MLTKSAIFFIFLIGPMLPDVYAQEGSEIEVRSFEDLPGTAVSGTPRLMRALDETEVFFSELNQSYVIPQGEQHNPFFFAMEKALKERRKISFKVDPQSHRILSVEGVLGVSAARPPPPSDSGESLPTPKRRVHRHSHLPSPSSSTSGAK